jgi:hypothetical protein
MQERRLENKRVSIEAKMYCGFQQYKIRYSHSSVVEDPSLVEYYIMLINNYQHF